MAQWGEHVTQGHEFQPHYGCGAYLKHTNKTKEIKILKIKKKTKKTGAGL